MHDAGQADPTPELTVALRNLGRGAGAEATLLPFVMTELRSVAAGYLAAQRADHTLQPTALVNEAFLKLFGSTALGGVRDRAHFFALAAKAMRQILVDHARARRAVKRGAARSGEETLGDLSRGTVAVNDELLDVDASLSELALLDERQARVVELRFFAGLEMPEVADVMELSLSTVEREWRAARAWLGRRLLGRAS